MKRKVIQLAGKTFVVSLPSKWARKYNVKKGDSVDVDEAESKLIISTSSDLMQDKTQIDISGMDPMIKRMLGAVYKSGYDEADVTFNTAAELETAQEVIREEFVGYEVARKGKNSIVVKNVSNIEYGEFDIILRRIFLVILTMAEEGSQAVKTQDKNWMKSVVFMDKDINRYADFCRRVINKHGYSQFKKSAPVYFIVEQLEKIGDCYRDICKASPKLSKGTMQMYEEVNAFFKEFYELYYKFDFKKMGAFGKKRYALKDKLNKLLESATKKEMPILFNLYTILENTFDMNGPLMATRI